MDISSPDSVKSMEVSLESFPEGTSHGITIRKDNHAFLSWLHPPPPFHLTHKQAQWLSPFPLSLCGTLQRRFDLRIPEMKLRGLAPNFYIHVSGSDLYVPTICRKIGRAILGIFKWLTDKQM
jgi:hypothetical protein